MRFKGHFLVGILVLALLYTALGNVSYPILIGYLIALIISPDIDLKFAHRNPIFHSPLIPLLALLYFPKYTPYILGASLSWNLHIICDGPWAYAGGKTIGRICFVLSLLFFIATLLHVCGVFDFLSYISKLRRYL